MMHLRIWTRNMDRHRMKCLPRAQPGSIYEVITWSSFTFFFCVAFYFLYESTVQLLFDFRSTSCSSSIYLILQHFARAMYNFIFCSHMLHSMYVTRTNRGAVISILKLSNLKTKQILVQKMILENTEISSSFV